MNGRKAIGTAGLVFLALAVNLLVWQQTVFAPAVLVPLVVALGLGSAWLLLVFASARGGFGLEGRAVGGVNAAVSSAVFLGICIVVYAFSAMWDVSWDLTQEGRRELAPQTVEVLRNMSQEVQVICFFLNVDDALVMIAREKTLRFLGQCQKHTELLKVQLLDPQVDRTFLEALDLTHASTQGTVVIKAGTRQRVITLSGGSPRLEERDFTNALINVLRDAEPKVYFLTGHGERDILDEDSSNGASMLGNLIRGQSYHPERLGIKVTFPEVPRDCSVLVINNPQGDLHPREVDAVQAYLERGGRLLLLLDPWLQVSQSVQGEVLRPWLEAQYGIRVGSDIVLSPQQENLWLAELTTDNTPFQGIKEGFMEYSGAFYGDHAVTRGFDQVMLLQASRSVCAAEEAPERVVLTELLRTTPDFYAETDVAKAVQTKQAVREEGEVGGPVSLAVAAVALTRQQDAEPGRRYARILVMGNSNFCANSQLRIPGHANFILNALAWLSENEELIAIRPTAAENPPLVLTQIQQRSIAWVSTLLSVQVIILAGIGVYLQRRKNQ